MSSLSSGINSASSVIMTDFVERFAQRKRAEASRIRWSRYLAAASGLVAVLLSSLMGWVPGNILAVTAKTNHVFVAPLFGLFLMALFVPFATSLGTLCGALAGCVAAIAVAYWDVITGGLASAGLLAAGGPEVSFQWISLTSLVANLLVAVPISWAQTARRRPRGAMRNE
jgi:SSS family solute:Na+ symporter